MIANLSLSVLSIVWIASVLADDPPKPLDKPGQTTTAEPNAKPATKAESIRPVAPGDEALLKLLEKKSAPSDEEANPLLRVGQRMRTVQGRLVKADTGNETQELQKGIVQDLDQLIEQLKNGGG